MSVVAVGDRPCACTAPTHTPRLVAVTGGPGAGKTAVLELAARSLCTHVGVLREAASVVFGGGFPREGTPAGRRAAQRAIFHIQRQLEALVIEEAAFGLVLCDRGTVDGLAYWPGEPDDFWHQVDSSLESELARYAAVIHLETPPADRGYNHRNILRTETAEQAIAIDRRIAAAWRSHPRRTHIASEDDFVAKASRALAALRREVPPCCQAAGETRR